MSGTGPSPDTVRYPVAGGPAGAPAAAAMSPAGPPDSTQASVPFAAGGDIAALVAERVRDVPDFPQPGILFKDLSPLLGDGPAFGAVIDGIVAWHGLGSFDIVAGIEARGFLVAAAVAHAAGTGVVAVRKAGKLPWRTISAAYALEYGEAVVEVHEDAFARASRVLLVDDVLATGGTLAAATDLVRRAGGEVVGMSVVVEIVALGGRARLAAFDLHTVLAV